MPLHCQKNIGTKKLNDDSSDLSDDKAAEKKSLAQINEDNKKIAEVLMSLDVNDKEKLSEAIGKIISVRLANTLIVEQGIGVQVATGKLHVNEAANLMAKLKDSIKDLVMIKRTTDGEDEKVNLTGPRGVNINYVTINGKPIENIEELKNLSRVGGFLNKVSDK